MVSSRDFIHIDDVIQCIYKAYVTEYKGVYNLASGRSYKISEIVDLFNTYSKFELKVSSNYQKPVVQDMNINNSKITNTFMHEFKNLEKYIYNLVKKIV